MRKETYADALEGWSERADKAGYFVEEYDPATDVSKNGIALRLYTEDAIEAWREAAP